MPGSAADTFGLLSLPVSSAPLGRQIIGMIGERSERREA